MPDTGRSIDVQTWHHYYVAGPNTPVTADQFTDPDFLDRYRCVSNNPEYGFLLGDSKSRWVYLREEQGIFTLYIMYYVLCIMYIYICMVWYRWKCAHRTQAAGQVAANRDVKA
jgi:hypothetical protein